MAMAPTQKAIWPGGFATDVDTIKDVHYVRESLAVKSKWKAEVDRVVQYRVKEGVELPAQVGPIGPQIDLDLDQYLPGGPNQIEFLVPQENRMSYLEIIGIREIY